MTDSGELVVCEAKSFTGRLAVGTREAGGALVDTGSPPPARPLGLPCRSMAWPHG
ncbi:hypothetical protein [Streptomyces sp. NPDC007991]|uniref:hypothetical protein n=1 Tax=Streptomyces sp. NPDC007991 TaxID=3364803 RepID=UPI0036EC77BB